MEEARFIFLDVFMSFDVSIMLASVLDEIGSRLSGDVIVNIPPRIFKIGNKWLNIFGVFFPLFSYIYEMIA